MKIKGTHDIHTAMGNLFANAYPKIYPVGDIGTNLAINRDGSPNQSFLPNWGLTINTVTPPNVRFLKSTEND